MSYRQSSKAGKLYSIGVMFVVCAMFGVLGLILPGNAHAAGAVSLSWNTNSEPDIAGYKVYYGTTKGSYTVNLNIGNYTGCVVSGLTAGKTYYFVATAYNQDGLESNYSTVLSYTVPGITKSSKSAKALTLSSK